jgi:hypothetical protein
MPTRPDAQSSTLIVVNGVLKPKLILRSYAFKGEESSKVSAENGLAQAMSWLMTYPRLSRCHSATALADPAINSKYTPKDQLQCLQSFN